MSDYIIKTGDTLSKIAMQKGVSVEDLLELNPDLKSHPNSIMAGAKLKVSSDHEPKTEGPDMNVQGLYIEREKEQGKNNTTVGAPLTFGAKTYVKRKQIKAAPKEMKNQANATKKAIKRTSNKIKSQRMTVKAKNLEKTAAAKKLAAEKAKNALNAEQKKLKELKDKLKLEKNSKTKEALKKQIEIQKDKVAKARAKNILAQRAATAAKTASKKVGKKVITRTMGKAAAKTAAKKIPVVGLLAGIAFAADRVMHGDFAGAAMEVVSGAASCVPGVGTAASVAIDAGLMYKDLKDSKVI